MPKFRRPKLGRPRRIGRIILIILLVIVLGSLGLFFYYDSKLHRVDALPGYAGRPSDTPGTTWLIVGMVVAGRKLPEAKVRALADGRVFTGRQALTEGLVDAIGGEREARAWLAAEKQVPEDLPVRDDGGVQIFWTVPKED